MTGQKDGGNYSCLVRNDSHAYQHSVALNVIGEYLLTYLLLSVLICNGSWIQLDAFARLPSHVTGFGRSEVIYLHSLPATLIHARCAEVASDSVGRRH